MVEVLPVEISGQQAPANQFKNKPGELMGSLARGPRVSVIRAPRYPIATVETRGSYYTIPELILFGKHSRSFVYLFVGDPFELGVRSTEIWELSPLPSAEVDPGAFGYYWTAALMMNTSKPQ